MEFYAYPISAGIAQANTCNFITKEIQVRLGLKVATILGLLFIGMLVLNNAFALISSPNDMAVVAGVAIILLYVAAATWIGVRIFKKAKDTVGKYRNSSAGRRASLILLAIVASGSTLFTTGCMTAVEPGHVGILVNKYGTYRGVSDFPLQTGAVWYNPFTETVYDYPTNVQRYVWTKDPNEGSSNDEEISYNSKDELVFTGDFTVSYQLIPEKVPAFYVKFRNDDIKLFTSGFFHDQVRNALNEVAVQYTADELYGEKKAEFLDKALALVRSRVADYGVDVVSLGYAAAPRPPDMVANAINGKITAIQKADQANNEVLWAEAEAKKKIAEANGTAQANALIAKSISPELIQWQQMAIQQQAINKWNGSLPQYSGGGAIPFIQVQK